MKEFLKENGKPSMMRLTTFLIVVVALAVVILQVIITDTNTFDYVPIVALLGLALTGKVVQKGIEKK